MRFAVCGVHVPKWEWIQEKTEVKRNEEEKIFERIIGNLVEKNLW